MCVSMYVSLCVCICKKSRSKREDVREVMGGGNYGRNLVLGQCIFHAGS